MPRRHPQSLRVSVFLAAVFVATTSAAQQPPEVVPFDSTQVSAQASRSSDAPINFSAAQPTTSLPREQPSVSQTDERTSSTVRLGEERSPFQLGMFGMPSVAVRGQAAELGVAGLNGSLAVPLKITPDGRDIWLATSAVDYWQLHTNAILPDSQLPVPGELWKASLGTMYLHNYEDGRRIGGLLSVGSASDRPFDDVRDMTLTSLAFYEVPRGPRDAWNFSLFYSPTSQLPYPIPGVAYAWRPNSRLTANIGIPFSLRFCPNDLWSISADYRPLTDVRLRAERTILENWSLYAGYEVTNETFWLAERSRSEDRLYFFDQRALLGVERRLPAGFCLDLSAAYLFDRQIFQAESFSGHRLDKLDLASGLGLSLRLLWSR